MYTYYRDYRLKSFKTNHGHSLHLLWKTNDEVDNVTNFIYSITLCYLHGKIPCNGSSAYLLCSCFS